MMGLLFLVAVFAVAMLFAWRAHQAQLAETVQSRVGDREVVLRPQGPQILASVPLKHQLRPIGAIRDHRIAALGLDELIVEEGGELLARGPNTWAIGRDPLAPPSRTYRLGARHEGGQLHLRAYRRDRLEDFARALAGFALALDEHLGTPWRRIASEQGWLHQPDQLEAHEGRVRVRVRYLEGRTRISLDFPSSLPARFRTARAEDFPADERFDNPVLDLLLGVREPPPDRRFDEPALAEELLALIHAHPGSLLKSDHLLLVVEGWLEDPRPMVRRSLDFVQRLA